MIIAPIVFFCKLLPRAAQQAGEAQCGHHAGMEKAGSAFASGAGGALTARQHGKSGRYQEAEGGSDGSVDAQKGTPPSEGEDNH